MFYEGYSQEEFSYDDQQAILLLEGAHRGIDMAVQVALLAGIIFVSSPILGQIMLKPTNPLFLLYGLALAGITYNIIDDNNRLGEISDQLT